MSSEGSEARAMGENGPLFCWTQTMFILIFSIYMYIRRPGTYIYIYSCTLFVRPLLELLFVEMFLPSF